MAGNLFVCIGKNDTCLEQQVNRFEIHVNLESQQTEVAPFGWGPFDEPETQRTIQVRFTARSGYSWCLLLKSHGKHVRPETTPPCGKASET